MRPLKRKLLGSKQRREWDGAHPGPIASQIHPTHVDRDLVRYEIYEAGEKIIKAWVLLPTPDQEERGCDLCPKKHSSKNNLCAANGVKRKIGNMRLVNISSGKPMDCFWRVVEWIIPGRYRSGMAELVRVR